MDKEPFKHMSEVQHHVAVTSHAFCDFLDTTRTLTDRVRIKMLKNMRRLISTQIKNIEQVHTMTLKDKRRPLKELIRDLVNVR